MGHIECWGKESYSVGLASPLFVFHSQKILHCVPLHFLQTQPSWPSAQSATGCCDYQDMASSSTGCEGCLLFVTYQKSICNFMNIFKIAVERSGQDFPMLPAVCVCTHPFVLTHSFWQLLKQLLYFIFFFPSYFFKLKQALILCILEAALFL